MFYIVFFFFFSSRRRHTRYWRDWSSDVCSSDLVLLERLRGVVGHGVVAVDLVNGQVSADKTYVRALVLIVVEIVIVRGRHDGVESSLGSLLSAGHAAPAHDGCAGNDVALERSEERSVV